MASTAPSVSILTSSVQTGGKRTIQKANHVKELRKVAKLKGRKYAAAKKKQVPYHINDRYWCTDADDDIKACGITCKALEDDDLTDDIACARRIYRQHKRQGGNGQYKPKPLPKKMIKSIAILFCVTNSFFSLARCKTFRPCELAKVLLDNDISKDDIATWLCIARYESTFNSSAVGHMSGDGSLDHGIFQINDRYWCTDADDDIKACGITCKALEDDDLTDDIACARRIYRQHKRQGGNGWTAWAVYPYYCTNREKNEQRFLKNNNCSLSSLSSLTSKIQLIPVAPVVNQVNPFTSTGSPNSIFNSNNHFTSPSPTVFNSNKFSPFKSSVPPVTTNYPVKQSSFSGSYQ
ncbi:uncharacterized protein LOC103507269 [Diaphorina citri]|uniref:lysozyme n=1 Tax=Diaphorina citri TaxID=121845 RepID=A0A1S3CXN1_DIACI|nr:uncharacterized protein LOC103507269 [Diaphorina citri]